MQNIIELVVGLCVFHSLLSVWESIKNFQPSTTTTRFYQGRSLDRKGQVIL